MERKAQGLSLNTIIIAAIVLIVLVVLWAIFTGRMGKFTTDLKQRDAQVPTEEAKFKALAGGSCEVGYILAAQCTAANLGTICDVGGTDHKCGTCTAANTCTEIKA